MNKKSSPIRFLLTREQWLGVAILAAIAGITLFTLHHFQPEESAPIVVSDSTITAFTAHQAQQDSLRKEQWKKKYPRDTIAIHLQPFDPNTADSVTLIHLGLKKWQVSNLLKYRAKNGRYHRPEDFRKLYGMTDSMYHALLPYIIIDTLGVKHFKDSINTRWRDSLDSIAVDTVPRYVHHKKDTVLNLRTADTTELKMLRGIGSYRAKQIVRYRQELGGYTSTQQLREIKALQTIFADSLQADSLLAHFYIDSVIVTPLYVNRASPEQLQRHPYLRFEQAQAIYELRRRKIQLDSIQQLYRLPCFSEEELLRLEPYLSFEARGR